jgi:beta-lactamase regulating signal transducer with metallopeptidase domain/thiol-disulfide isomerase/thioredoxin
MSPLSSFLLDVQAGPTALLVLLMLKVTALLAVAWLLHLVLAGTNPRWRVLLWRAAGMGVLLLFGLALCPPLMSWAVLPAETLEQTALVKESTGEEVVSPKLDQSAKPRPLTSLPPNVDLQRSALPEAPSAPTVVGPSVANAVTEASTQEVPADPVEFSAVSPATDYSLWTSMRWIAAIWLLGVLVCLLCRAAGLWFLFRVIRRAEPVPEWVESVGFQVAKRFALRRRFTVRQTSKLPVPCLASILWPVVLLPERQCDAGLREELPSILAHELAHLKGGDLVWSRLLHVLSNLLWFHPLAWRMPAVHGNACDGVCDAVAADYVGDADAYGRTLARLALRVAAGPSVGLAMAGKSNVRRRVEAVQRYVFRAGLPRRRAWMVLAPATVGILLLGGVALTRSAAALPAEEAAEAVGEKKAENPDGEADAPKQSVLTIRCRDEATEEPMEGVRFVYVGIVDGQSFKRTHTINRNEVADLKYPAGDIVEYFWVIASKSGYVPIHHIWRNDRRTIDLPERLDFRFEKGIKIGGVVQDEGGKPIAGAKIDLKMPITWPRLANHVFEAGEVKADENGRWEWDSAPKSTGNVSMRVTHPDYLRGGGRPAASMENVVVLKQGLQVEGRVLDSEGNPVEGAVAQLGFDRFGTGEPKATTDAEGRFVIKDCKPGRSAVTVEADGLTPDAQAVTIAEETEPLEFTLKPGHVLRGQVVDVDGKPIEGVLVAPDTWRGYRTLEQQMKTDAEGRFEWRGAPPDAVEYSILKQGYMSKRDSVLVASEEEQVITLYPELEVCGRVTDAVTGKVVPEFRIRRGQIQHNRETPYWTRDEGVLYKDGEYTYKFDEPMKGWLLQVTAPGYLPATSRTFASNEGRQTFDFTLQPGNGPSGIVLLPSGEPAEGADVGLATGERRASLEAGKFDRSQNSADLAKTNEEGRFSFTAQDDVPFLLIVVHEVGYAEATSEELKESDRITLKSWGRLEGKVVVGDEPDAGREVSFSPKRPPRPKMGMPVWSYGYRTKTDNQGHFEFDRVIPGAGSVARVVITEFGRGAQHSPCWQTPVEIPEGATTEVTIGGTGQPVRGQVVLDREPDVPVDWTTNEPAKIVRWDKENGGRSEVYQRYAASIDETGQFEIPDVPAGDYKLTLPVNNPPTPNACGAGNAIGRAELVFSVPEMPGGRSDEPLDLGTVEVTMFDTLDVGEIAPEFVARKLDGESLRLEQYRGKLILLDFWATWCKPCLAEFPNLKKIHEAFGSDSRFVMLSLSCDNELAAPRDYVNRNDLPWQQLHVPGTSTGPASQYTVRSLPATFLIAPNGNVLAKNLHGDELKEAVAGALANEELFDIEGIARAPRFPVTRFESGEDPPQPSNQPSVVVLDNTDPKWDRDIPHHDSLRALTSSGEELWKHSGFNCGQTVGGVHGVVIDRERGRIYVRESVGDKVHAFTLDGRKAWQIDNIEAGVLAVDEKTGDVWCSGGGRLNAGETVVFDLEGNEKTSFLHRAIDMAYDPHSDSFWLVGYEIINLSREGEIRFQEKVAGWCCPSVSVNGTDGSIWTVERDHSDIPKSKSRLWLRNADGSVRHVIELDDYGPFAVEYDPESGRAWVNSYRSGIRQYSAEGKLVKELTLPGNATAISPSTGEIWINREDALLRVDPAGQIIARSPHGKPSSQAWFAAF